MTILKGPGRCVVVVVYDGVRLLDVSGPLEAFTVANEHGAAYRLRTASPGGRDITTSGGVRMGADLALEDLALREPAPEAPDVLLVPGSPDVAATERNRPLLDQVARLSGQAGCTASVCAGAFVLAAAGILDGHRAATHWHLADRLARSYPRVAVDPDAIFVRDGRIITSAGVTAGIDLALGLIEEDHGAGLARTVARHLVVFMQRPGGQSQFSARLSAGGTRDRTVRSVLDAVAVDPAADHGLAAAAARAGLSVRQLTRLFRRETGTTLARYVELVRVETARSMLESGDDPLDAVARRAGFGSPETLRRAFLRELGVPPAAYRARFRTTGVGAGWDGPRPGAAGRDALLVGDAAGSSPA
ncbi:DJ-1/PfpI family protein [Microbispora sp. RL4-1S]|uniref:DJ-1/PfpI family protein n=1 Tax=Microbispora oryzae TaxID=2806554 RepID=A0A940WDZ3_9ACTN|nr:DJ-1/PfpI family protein [Microbispora oryzae]MBP2703775.1 DJ-1/PfpI family protein [Microbispora oryzae]